MLHAEREEQAMATNMYLKFIEPNVPAQGELEVLSWSHGFVQPTSPTRSTAGSGTVEQATHQNLTFTKYLDASTNELLKACWSGKHTTTKIRRRCTTSNSARWSKQRA